MKELPEERRAMAVHCVGQQRVPGNAVARGGFQEMIGERRGLVDPRDLGDDQPGAASGPGFLVGHIAITRRTL